MKKLTHGQFIAIGTLIVLLGILIMSSQYLLSKRNSLFEYINMKLYFDQLNNVPSDPVNPDEPQNVVIDPDIPDEPEQEPEPEVITENFAAILEIPEIGLQKGIYALGSKYNTVNRNVAILSPSDYPDVQGGNFILAAHSGNGYLSFFKDLYKLNVGSYAYVYYNDIKYTYNIIYIYTQQKTGTISVQRPYGKTTLMLITCTKDDESTQTVYVAELVAQEPHEAF